MLTEELNMESERDRNALELLLQTVLGELSICKLRGGNSLLTNPLDGQHSAEQKYQFLLLRFLSKLDGSLVINCLQYTTNMRGLLPSRNKPGAVYEPFINVLNLSVQPLGVYYKLLKRNLNSNKSLL